MVKNRYYIPYDTKKYIKNYQMKVICNKEHMINCYQLKKNRKKRGMPQKLRESGQKWEKCVKNRKKLVKNCYYLHFDKKMYIKNYKIRVIWNKDQMKSYYQLKKYWKKSRDATKIRPKLGQN